MQFVVLPSVQLSCPFHFLIGPAALRLPAATCAVPLPAAAVSVFRKIVRPWFLLTRPSRPATGILRFDLARTRRRCVEISEPLRVISDTAGRDVANEGASEYGTTPAVLGA
jgi:hypothetical protein